MTLRRFYKGLNDDLRREVLFQGVWEKKAEQGNAVDEEYEFTAFTVKNTNVSTKN
jgi:hypothetical protein